MMQELPIDLISYTFFKTKTLKQFNKSWHIHIFPHVIKHELDVRYESMNLMQFKLSESSNVSSTYELRLQQSFLSVSDAFSNNWSQTVNNNYRINELYCYFLILGKEYFSYFENIRGFCILSLAYGGILDIYTSTHIYTLLCWRWNKSSAKMPGHTR